MELTEYEDISINKILEFMSRPSDLGLSYTKHSNSHLTNGGRPYSYACVYTHGNMKFYNIAFRLKSIHWDNFYCIVYDTKHMMFFNPTRIVGLKNELKEKIKESIINYKGGGK